MHQPLTLRTRALLIWATWTASVSLGSLAALTANVVMHHDGVSFLPCMYPLLSFGVIGICHIFRKSGDEVMSMIIWQFAWLGCMMGLLNSFLLLLTFDLLDEIQRFLPFIGPLGILNILLLVMVFRPFVQQKLIWLPVLVAYALVIIAVSVFVYMALSQRESIDTFDIRAEAATWLIISVGFGCIPGALLAWVMRTIPPAVAQKYQARIDKQRQHRNARTARWVERGGFLVAVVVLGGMSFWTIRQWLQPCQWLDVIARRSGCVQVINTYDEVLALSPDGILLAWPDFAEVVYLYDTSDWQLERALSTRQGRNYIEALRFSPDSTLLAAATWHQVYLWRVDDGTLIHSWSIADAEDEYGVTSPYIAFSLDGEQIAMNTRERGLVIHSTHGGELLRTVPDEGVLSPDWTMLATRSGVQRLRDGTTVSTMRNTYRSRWSPDNTMIAKEQVSEGVTDVWRIRDGTLLHTLRYAEMMQPYGWHPDEYVFSELAWSPDGRMLLVGASYSDSAFDDDIPDGGAWIWRVRDGALLWSVVLEDGVRGVTWLPDGQHIATQSSGDLQIWRMPSQP